MSNTTISQLPVANSVTGTSAFPADIANTTYQVSTTKLGNYITNHATTVVASGNITGGNLLTAGQVSAAGNLAVSNVLTSGQVSAIGNITGNYIFGNVSQSTGFPAMYGDSNVASFLLDFGSNSISTTGNITSSVISSGNLYITGPATILGNLQVLGNTTTINSNVVTTNDLSVNFANNAINSSAANGGGIEVGPQGSPYITWFYNSTANTWNSGGGISVAGSVSTAGNVNATGSVNANNVSATGNVGATGNVNANNVSATGSVNAGNVSATGTVAAATVTASTPIAATSGGTGLSAAGSSGNLLVSDGSNWISSGLAASGVKLGLGITGETWHDVTGSRSQGVTYTNSRSYPIQVQGNFGCNGGGQGYIYIDGTLVSHWAAQFNGCGGYSVNMPCIVPAGSTYQLANMGGGSQGWYELY